VNEDKVMNKELFTMKNEMWINNAKGIFLLIAIFPLLVACKNPLVINILPSRELTGLVVIYQLNEDTLKADTSDLGGSGNISYQWRWGEKDGFNTNYKDIMDTDSSTYKITKEDAGKYIAVTVSRSHDEGTVTSELFLIPAIDP
jgi:hypothetical protein